MNALIQKLGKPRSWLIFAATCLAGLFLGGLCVGLYFAGLQAAGRVGFWVTVACWATSGFSCLSYFIGQFSGRYRELQGKSWAELPW
jgi:Trk-type K+ transport system membrane component